MDTDHCRTDRSSNGRLGLVGTYAGVTDPQWHAALKIVVGLVAVAVGFMEKKE